MLLAGEIEVNRMQCCCTHGHDSHKPFTARDRLM